MQYLVCLCLQRARYCLFGPHITCPTFYVSLHLESSILTDLRQLHGKAEIPLPAVQDANLLAVLLQAPPTTRFL
jgi:hypothetical protein